MSQTGAQDYPTKVITMIVPFTAGGPTERWPIDRVPMTKTLKQQVIVENVGAPAGNRREPGSQGDPDGYTILIHHIGMSTAPALYRSCPISQ